jgi:hypothetical protein
MGKADNPLPSSADVTYSGSLNLSEHCGPHRAVMGILKLFIQSFQFEYTTLYIDSLNTRTMMYWEGHFVKYITEHN